MQYDGIKSSIHKSWFFVDRLQIPACALGWRCSHITPPIHLTIRPPINLAASRPDIRRFCPPFPPTNLPSLQATHHLVKGHGHKKTFLNHLKTSKYWSISHALCYLRTSKPSIYNSCASQPLFFPLHLHNSAVNMASLSPVQNAATTMHTTHQLDKVVLAAESRIWRPACEAFRPRKTCQFGKARVLLSTHLKNICQNWESSRPRRGFYLLSVPGRSLIRSGLLFRYFVTRWAPWPVKGRVK